MGALLDKRLLPDAPDCWVVGEDGFAARIAVDDGGGAQAFADAMASADSGGFRSEDVPRLGDQAFCTTLSAMGRRVCSCGSASGSSMRASCSTTRWRPATRVRSRRAWRGRCSPEPARAGDQRPVLAPSPGPFSYSSSSIPIVTSP